MVNIDYIMDLLDWNNSIEMQEQGIELASSIKNLSTLIMPIENKLIWENCAKVLAGKTDETLKIYLYELFEWLQDMNWPGAYLIYDRLIYLSDELFMPAYNYSLLLAEQTNDKPWEMALRDLFAGKFNGN